MLLHVPKPKRPETCMETGLPKTPRGMAVSERLSLSKETQVYYFSVVVVVVVGGEYIYIPS